MPRPKKDPSQVRNRPIVAHVKAADHALILEATRARGFGTVSDFAARAILIDARKVVKSLANLKT